MNNSIAVNPLGTEKIGKLTLRYAVPSVIALLINSLYNTAFGITTKVSQLITSVAWGISTGVQPILSYNYGNGQYDRVKKTFKTARTSATIIMVIAFFVFQLLSEVIIQLFGQESELYMEFAVKCFRIYLLACFLIPCAMVIGILFQAIGKPLPAMALSLSRQIIFLIPATFIFSAVWGVEGVLWAGFFSDTLAAIVAIATVWAYWKHIFTMGGNEE